MKLKRLGVRSRSGCALPETDPQPLILIDAVPLILVIAAQLKTAEFTTLRNRLLKIAARVIESATRIRIAFASACPDAALFRELAITLNTASP